MRGKAEGLYFTSVVQAFDTRLELVYHHKLPVSLDNGGWGREVSHAIKLQLNREFLYTELTELVEISSNLCLMVKVFTATCLSSRR